MLIDLLRLPEAGERFRGEEPASILELSPDDEIHALGPVYYDFTAVVISGELVVRGMVGVRVECLCSRCGEPFSLEARDTQFEVSMNVAGLETVDLTEEIREASILAFPYFPVCRESCRGVCPVCGTNLNRGSCSCVRPADNRWDTLNQLEL